MATISPSPDSAPSGVPPTSFSPPPQPSNSPPPTSSATPPPQPSTPSPPPPDLNPPVAQPDANPPDPSTPSPPTLPNAPPPSNSGASPPPLSPPPTSSAPPPSTPPPTPVTAPPPANVSPPPPQADPPVNSPPPIESPPPPTLPNPPTSAPPPPPSSTPPPTSSPPPPSSTPPRSPPTPPSSDPPTQSPPPPPQSEPPVGSPPPPSSRPPENSPPPPASEPPRRSPAAPSPPASEPPQSSPSPPAVRPPSSSPPSDPNPASPPSVVTPSPPSFSRSPPSPGSQTTVPSSPGSPANDSSSGLPQSGNGGIGSGVTIAIVVAGVLTLGLIALVALWMYKRKKRTSGANGGIVIPLSRSSSPRSDANLLVKTGYPAPLFGGGSGSDTPTDHGGFGHSRSWFTYQELYDATSGFSDKNLLGEGGFGCVYKGILADGRVVAVKQLKIGGGQGEREFKAEVEIISRIHHRHLVSLVGYCIWETRRLLVYDFVANDTLHFHLHGGDRPVMDWATRVKIAAGAARGIAYLHEDCHPRIIHRDIKSSNILLDNNFDARVSDFGLAKLAMDADTHVSTRVMGTFGYLAPEYATSGKLTEKSDVYSFGVVLLELITGRKPVDESQPLGDESLVEWARPLLTHALDTGEFEGLVDPRLGKNYIESEMFRMIEAAAACVRHSAAKRPRMGQVVRAFDGISDSGDLSNGLRVGESQLYNSAQQSAEIRWFRRMAFGSQDISTDFFSQPTHNLGFSNQNGQNSNFSAQRGQGGSNISRQYSQDSRDLGFSGQSGPGTSTFSAQRGPALAGDISRQTSHNTYHSTMRSQNVEFSNQQGNRDLNFGREDGMNR